MENHERIGSEGHTIHSLLQINRASVFRPDSGRHASYPESDLRLDNVERPIETSSRLPTMAVPSKIKIKAYQTDHCHHEIVIRAFNRPTQDRSPLSSLPASN